MSTLLFVALVPLHAPEAAQLAAFAVDQLKVVLPPLGTLKGRADKETVGVLAPQISTGHGLPKYSQM